MILDDGGDATLLIHLGMKAEKDLSVVSKPTNDEEEALFAAITQRVAETPGRSSALGKAIRGVTEETTTGVHRLYEMQKAGTRLAPTITGNNWVKQMKFDKKALCVEAAGDANP